MKTIATREEYFRTPWSAPNYKVGRMMIQICINYAAGAARRVFCRTFELVRLWRGNDGCYLIRIPTLQVAGVHYRNHVVVGLSRLDG